MCRASSDYGVPGPVPNQVVPAARVAAYAGTDLDPCTCCSFSLEAAAASGADRAAAAYTTAIASRCGSSSDAHAPVLASCSSAETAIRGTVDSPTVVRVASSSLNTRSGVAAMRTRMSPRRVAARLATTATAASRRCTAAALASSSPASNASECHRQGWSRAARACCIC